MSEQDDAQLLRDMADLWVKANAPGRQRGYDAMRTLREQLEAEAFGIPPTVSMTTQIDPHWARVGMPPGARKVVHPDKTWELFSPVHGDPGEGYSSCGPFHSDIWLNATPLYREISGHYRVYCASTQQWAEWDEATGAWVESTDPTAQGSVVLPPAIPQEPEQMLLEGVLAELYDSANGSVAQERVGRLLARYQALTGKRAPEFLRGH